MLWTKEALAQLHGGGFLPTFDHMNLEEVVRQDITQAAKLFGYTEKETARVLGLYHDGCEVHLDYMNRVIRVVEVRPRFVPFADPA